MISFLCLMTACCSRVMLYYQNTSRYLYCCFIHPGLLFNKFLIMSFFYQIWHLDFFFSNITHTSHKNLMAVPLLKHLYPLKCLTLCNDVKKHIINLFSHNLCIGRVYYILEKNELFLLVKT